MRSGRPSTSRRQPLLNTRGHYSPTVSSRTSSTDMSIDDFSMAGLLMAPGVFDTPYAQISHNDHVSSPCHDLFTDWPRNPSNASLSLPNSEYGLDEAVHALMLPAANTLIEADAGQSAGWKAFPQSCSQTENGPSVNVSDTRQGHCSSTTGAMWSTADRSYEEGLPQLSVNHSAEPAVTLQNERPLVYSIPLANMAPSPLAQSFPTAESSNNSFAALLRRSMAHPCRHCLAKALDVLDHCCSDACSMESGFQVPELELRMP